MIKRWSFLCQTGPRSSLSELALFHLEISRYYLALLHPHLMRLWHPMFQDDDGIHPQSYLRWCLFFSPLPWSGLAMGRKWVLSLNKMAWFFLNYDFRICKARFLGSLVHAVSQCCYGMLLLLPSIMFSFTGFWEQNTTGAQWCGFLWGRNLCWSKGPLTDGAVGEAEFLCLWVYVLSWEDRQCRFCIPVPGLFTAAIPGKGKENLPALSLEKRCQCQLLKNVIKANEKRVEDIFMSLEYCAWEFYGDHRKPERQSHS